jgi:hypothetical protein
LHVNKTTILGDKSAKRIVSTPELFTKRIVDELVRFPARRKQLMRKGDITKISTITQPIRQGDQYIIPESSTTWTNLLRLDWARQIPEEPKYYEEMSREVSNDDYIPPEGIMTSKLATILRKDTTLRLKIPDITTSNEQPLMPFTAILGVTLEELGLEYNAKILDRASLIKYVQITSKPIGMINLRDDINEKDKILFIRPFTGSFDSVTIFVFLPDQVGLLVEEEGNATVKLKALSEEVLDAWKRASVVQVRKKRVEEVGEEVPKVVAVIGQNPIMAKVKRRPLVANIKTKALVEKKEPDTKTNDRNTTRNTKNKNINIKTTRRRPRIAPE